MGEEKRCQDDLVTLPSHFMIIANVHFPYCHRLLRCTNHHSISCPLRMYIFYFTDIVLWPLQMYIFHSTDIIVKQTNPCIFSMCLVNKSCLKPGKKKKKKKKKS